MENYTKYALKPWEELAALLEDKENIFVVACNKCFKAFETMEEPECDKLVALADGLDKHVTGVMKADFLCNQNHTGKALQLPEGTENVVVLSCGLGVQTVAAMLDKPVYAACDSICYTGHHGMALTKKACDACAQCYLGMTGGICPVVDCSKSLLNGQCGGAKDGKCEVSPDKDCAWQKIQERLEKQGRLEEFAAQSVQLRDYSKVNFKVINEYVQAIRAKRQEGWYGGIHPVEGKEPTQAKALVKFPVPETVVIPLSMHLGAPANPIVNVGDYVKMGQKIGEAAGFISAPVHSSVSGKVIAIQDLPHATRGTCTAIVIENDGKDTPDESIKPNKPLEELTPAEIIEIVKNAGIVGMGGAGFPTYVKLNPGKPIEAVLVNACECEPMLTADHRVLLEYADEIVFGLKAVMKTVAAPKGIIVIEENKPDAIELLRKKVA
ncbi:MAG: methylenetetrahydrofolate reductase C-terminal domain-containing protein, partial [Oscillospiraceae bacterium]|nr:methylenetetrahydrofolate reductase C-terminal domain-containing protein [Oscillospiraceae bacterium]